MVTRGIDVSAYQTVNYLTAARYIDFLIVKCTEGTRTTSGAFVTHWRGAKGAKLLRGTYHVAHPEATSAVAEAAHYVAVLKANGFRSGYDLPPVLDIEPGTVRAGVAKSAITAFARTFMSHVDSLLGLREPWQRCGLYVGDSIRASVDVATIANGRWFWRGGYGSTWTDAIPLGCSIYQRVGPTSLVPGVSGNGLDIDMARPEDLRRLAPEWFGSITPPAPQPEQPAPTPAPAPAEDLDMPTPYRLVQLQKDDGTRDPAVYAVTLTGVVHIKNPNHLSQLAAAKAVELDAAGKPVIHPIGQQVFDDLREVETQGPLPPFPPAQ